MKYLIYNRWKRQEGIEEGKGVVESGEDFSFAPEELGIKCESFNFLFEIHCSYFDLSGSISLYLYCIIIKCIRTQFFNDTRLLII